VRDVLTVIGSAKGAPGVTTLAVALAVRWPEPATTLLVEADPFGGVLGSRWLLHVEPGLRTMVASVRHGSSDLADCSQRLPLGVDVVAAPTDSGASTTVDAFARSSTPRLLELARSQQVLVDVGRLYGDSPALALVDVADCLVLVARPELEDVRHLQAVLTILRDRCPVVHLVLNGMGRYPPAEIGDVLGVNVAAVIGHDPASADVLAGRRRPAMGWTRRRLPVAARTLARDLASPALAVPASPAIAADATRIAAEVTP
jgi:MinD-like ATPase involved in chromosome partitioning or flagellar assembly